MLLNFVFQGTHCYGQQPAYSIFGEDQFRGIQVYDVIQDKDHDFWISTNEGLYYYNYSEYQKVDCGKAKSNSVFNFVKDQNGTIYCNNINNQIFKIHNKKLLLFYELKKEESSQDISLAIGDDNNLLISSNQILVLNSKGKKVTCKKIEHHYIGQQFVTKTGMVQYHLSSSKLVLSYSKGKFKTNYLKSASTPRVLKIVKTKNVCFAVDLITKKSYHYNPLTFSLTEISENNLLDKNGALRIYESKKGIWIAGTLPGVYFLKSDLNPKNQKLIYTDYFISDVYEDEEGNTLLSTFDKGIILIPSIHIPDVIAPFYDDPITTILSTKKRIFLGSSKGKLMAFDNNQFTILNKNWKRPIEVIECDASGKSILFDDGSIVYYNTEDGTFKELILASLKDVAFVNQNHFYLGTNQGVYEFKKEKNAFSFKSIPSLNSRIHSLEYNPSNKSLYVSSALGMFIYTNNGKLKPLKFKNNELYPLDIYHKDSRIYVCTKDIGILVYKNDHLIRRICVYDNLKHLVFKKVILTKDGFIGSTSTGMYLFDQNGEIKKIIHSNYGFSGNRIIDFTIHENKLWVSHSRGVQKIDLKNKTLSTNAVQLRIDNILINNQLSKPSEIKTLSSSQRKIQFNFSTPTLRNQNSIHYYYRLLGNDTTWNINSFKFNQVTYNALSSGSYTFQIKVENQGKFSETKSIHFRIQSPFYFRWWFISLNALLFFLIVYLIYRNQLAKQKRKSDQINELNASKLTAIQSQMNPHFIFNAMNSIQDLILKGNVEHSYSYITTFSNLVRKTLNYSEREFIEFEQEIELLELYLSLEKLRFKAEFSYSIDTNSISSIKIPPMLIQPFIENALGHGLIHRDGEKTLHISFELQDVLLCKIEDNGVGRNKAKEIRERQRADHESFSGKAIQKRFEILSNHYNGKLGFEYVDKIENGESTGTIVYLKIPYFQNF